MGTASIVRPSDPTAALSTERPAAPSQRRSDSGLERRLPSARETLATLPEGEALDFEPHDTIPAPPWLEDLEEQKSSPVNTP